MLFSHLHVLQSNSSSYFFISPHSRTRHTQQRSGDGRYPPPPERAQDPPQKSRTWHPRQAVFLHQHSRLVFPHRRPERNVVREWKIPWKNSLPERVSVQATWDNHEHAVGTVRPREENMHVHVRLSSGNVEPYVVGLEHIERHSEFHGGYRNNGWKYTQ